MMSLLFTRRLANAAGVTFLLVMVWKFMLLAGTAQPIPANDAFGYDGAVVNYLLNGHYTNPALAIPFPFSATTFFCTYPPLYQAVLYLWMSVFGPTVLSAMWFHWVLFGLYALTLLAIFRRLKTPGWAVNLAGLFLLGITFDDRPDGLAHLLGMLAVYAWVRSAEPSVPSRGWPWLASLLVVLALGTNPEIGGLYFGWLWLLTLGAADGRRRAFPLPPMAFLLVAPVALVALVKYGRPDIWAGFMEHAGQTPSFTGWRRPAPGDVLKVIRTIPAVLFIAVLLLPRLRGLAFHRRSSAEAETEYPASLLLYSAMVISLGLTAGVLFLFAADWILILAFFQPLIVGAFLTLAAKDKALWNWWLTPVFLGLVLLVSVRMVGMSTWGVACARDVNEAAAVQRVRTELDKLPPDATVVMSSSYLYDAMNQPGARKFIHEDWTHRADEPPGKLNGDTLALIRLKPAALILTQFDYYRRYQTPLAELAGLPGQVTITMTNAARVRAPDSFPQFKQVVQHIAWAPVIVEFEWKR
jgi:hypothetical protein